MKNEYVQIDYAPVTANDKVFYGPFLICDGFPSLTGTAFVEHGIDCAFASHNGNEAFIFSGNLCALIDYAPHTKNDKDNQRPDDHPCHVPLLQRDRV
ncbi:putative Hemopexin-like domain-containing protein [Rosa chinensis]|uniref:Putative Hemopexin-like domain-containing protein n=1 Tax=Rosa chinensis TaxID=74649 RepID=A0A2P6QLT0_ROSCH|nr:putative Hemopexin-like domain-containing protein [Rosa chinensis]